MDEFSDLNRSADDNEEYSTESDLNEKENDVKDATSEMDREAMSDVEKEAVSEVEGETISDVEKEAISDVENTLNDEQKETASDAERELLHEVEEEDVHDKEEEDLQDDDEDVLQDDDEDVLQDAEEDVLQDDEGDDLDDVKSINEEDVEQVAPNTGMMNDPVVSGGVYQSDDHHHGDDPDGANHLFQDPQEIGSSEDTHKKEDDYSHTLNEPPTHKEQFSETMNETNNPPSNGEGKNDQINKDTFPSLDPIEFDKKRYEHFLIYPSYQKNMSLSEGINKKLTFPSLSPTDFPIPGKEEESITMYHFNPEKFGYKYNNGLNPSEGYLLIYPHVSHHSVPPKIKKKKLRCC
ncbi:Uncharacterized protein PCOAH_00036140 [Plasmodium coatneyi]|uniref:Uncharacterized protein n=1 Tax=Plasmodium coatneyi TaxID=208452 RepID=A0A1B1E1U1_9APIC|nr:Uncharacterized protein PCOAH_00036140 [Plasmodium coatneyi]ANQ09006.1 Uncharacterized protein PCOAH_00036140 [Plasmodium coatneyi]